MASIVAMPTVNTSVDTNATNGNTSSTNANNTERRCENADCNVFKLVSLVPKRKTTQFVTEPKVMEKPMLINGFTTVFQVDGCSAKLNDLKNPNPGAPVQPKTIYRIVPNTHAHIVNYVVVDADGDSMRKINESDPATMRKLLESQKVSADQMLKKLMAGHGAIVGSAPPSSAPSSVAPISGASVPAVSTIGSTARPTRSATSTPSAISIVSKSAPVSTQQSHSSSIQLPLRMHPNLKITAVASAETVAALNAPLVSSTIAAPLAPPAVPLITPVPLASLQNAVAPSALPVLPNVISSQVPPNTDVADKPIFDKMQAELQELRRTVAMLAEAQAKNQNQQTQPVRPGVKRPRPA